MAFGGGGRLDQIAVAASLRSSGVAASLSVMSTLHRTQAPGQEHRRLPIRDTARRPRVIVPAPGSPQRPALRIDNRKQESVIARLIVVIWFANYGSTFSAKGIGWHSYPRALADRTMGLSERSSLASTTYSLPNAGL